MVGRAPIMVKRKGLGTKKDVAQHSLLNVVPHRMG